MQYRGIWEWPKYMLSEIQVEEYEDGSKKVVHTGRKKLLRLIFGILGISLMVSFLEYSVWGILAAGVAFILQTLIAFVTAFYFLSFTVKNYEVDEKTGDKVVKDRPTDARFMTEDEEDTIFERVDKVKETTRKILGKDDAGKLCSLKDIAFSNDNLAIIGYPGSGKSACLVNTHIFQCIRAGKSFVVTDSKGAVYEQTAAYAREKGYDLKILNLKPKEMKYSDGVEMMKTITDQMGGETMANIIMENAAGGGEKQDFWYKCEFNLLKAMILMVKFSTDIPDEEKTLIKVHEMLLENDVEQITEKMLAIDNPAHPAYAAARGFALSRDQVRESAYGGLSVKLSLLAQPAVKQILSHDEIDLRKPLSKKCAYYVIISDTDASAKFLACLFFKTLFMELIDESDSVYHQHPPVSVEFILDEFANTGSIPGFNHILSVARSRKLNIEFILQDITQLQAMYPDNWHEIMNDCAGWLLIATREPETMKYFASIFGERYIIRESMSYGINGNAITQNVVDRHMSESFQKESILSPWQIFLMSRDKLLFSYAGQNPILLTKYMYWNHPVYKKIEKEDLHMFPKDHISAWRQELIDKGEDLQDNYIPEESTRKNPYQMTGQAEDKEDAPQQEARAEERKQAAGKKDTRNTMQKAKEENAKNKAFQAMMNSLG